MRIQTVRIPADNRHGYKIINADDPRAVPAPSDVPASPEDIDALKKADLIGWLEAHNADTSGKVSDLRPRLKSIMFVGAENAD